MAYAEADLRHMMSSSLLSSPRSPHRASQHIRLGSRSPNSIPSSPTSVHSSSSAIFERDIEPIMPPSPPFLAHQNPHRIPRAKGTEQLEHSVPSVLDSAAAVLATLEDTDTVDHVAVVAPAHPTAPLDSILARTNSSGFASPIGSFRSRSPSPLGIRVATGPGPIPRTELLLSIPSANPQALSGPAIQRSPPQSVVPSPPAPSAAPLPARSAVQTNPANPPTLPAIVTPTSASLPNTEYSPTSEQGPVSHTSVPAPAPAPASSTGPSAIPSQSQSQAPSGGTTSHPTQPISITSPATNFASPTSWTSNLSHPPSPTHNSAKRLSFMSYSDLLSSTPASMLPLSSLTTSASSTEPPPHIPSVSGLHITSAAHQQGGQHLGLVLGGGVNTGSAATSLRGFAIGPTGGITHPGKRDSIAMLDDVGGEWEKEGLGRGLEERLEALIAASEAPKPVGIVMKT